MRVVWKYPLNMGDTVVTIPIDAKIIHVGAQNSVVTIWALVDPLNENEQRYFGVRGTGHQVIDSNTTHVGSVIEGAFVWHVFEVTA